MKARPQCPRRLQPYQVRLVRQMRREGFSQRFIASRLGVSRAAIQAIETFSTYKDIK